jgi:TPR repeat protein
MNLGTMYLDGSGVEQNYVLARKWFGKAAEQGNSVAQHRLGYLYEKGLGVKKMGRRRWRGIKNRLNKETPSGSSAWPSCIAAALRASNTIASRPLSGTTKPQNRAIFMHR